MDNKIYEEALTSALRRIEVLEDKLSRISIPNKQGFYELATKVYPGEATPGQIKYIGILKGVVRPGLTKEQAGIEIDRLLKLKKVTDSHQESPIVTEPAEVDTDDAGLDAEDMM